MKWAVSLGRWLGIKVSVHFSVVLLLAMVAWATQDTGAAASAWATGLFLAIFLCILLHELGHCVMAMHYGVRVRSIVLLPIGGVASMNGIPERPWHELLIAVAGPAVNVVIAGLLLLTPGGWPGLTGASGFPESVPEFRDHMLRANVMLVLFNMCPAFPMDGGRVLRSLLAMVVPFARATRIAATVGRIIALGFMAAGVMFNPFLFVIGLFVFWGASAENEMVRMKDRLHDVSLDSLIRPPTGLIDAQTPVRECLHLVYGGNDPAFAVVDEGRIAGVISRARLIEFFRSGDADTPAREVADHRFIAVHTGANPEQLLREGLATRGDVFPVVNGQQLVGWLWTSDLIRAAGREPDPSGRTGAARPRFDFG